MNGLVFETQFCSLDIQKKVKSINENWMKTLKKSGNDLLTFF